MARYFDGYHKAQAQIQRMTKDELLSHIDVLYGREKLESDDTEHIREEAQRQCTLDFADTSATPGDLNYGWAQGITAERKSYTEL